jgi:asparagine synthase (glutamine-hydrolysing)
VSVQAGMWNWDGKPISREWMSRLDETVAEYGPDGAGTHIAGPIGILYRAFHTTPESRSEQQPWIAPSGNVITWDGRLDNREDIRSEFGLSGNSQTTDLEIVSAAFEQWNEAAFGKLIGDWAVAIWQPGAQTLTLATDFSGVRSLYYYANRDSVFWCKLLAPIVLLSNLPFTLNEHYIAGYLVSYPEAHITPFEEVRPVPAGHYVTIQPGRTTVNRHWRFLPERRIRYKADADYEEHFRHLFRQSVRRRIRSGSPILADLSGGLDSSSIVCMADQVVADAKASAPRIDTLSFYDAKEPLGDERKYISLIENKRGCNGHHIDVEKYGHFFALRNERFSAEPQFPANEEFKKDFRKLAETHGYRVFLSGFAGDEFLGGVPDPRSQLADLLVTLHFLSFCKQLFAWSLAKKAPWVQLFYQSVSVLIPDRLKGRNAPAAQMPAWIDLEFARKRYLSKHTNGLRKDLGFWLPSRREYAGTLATILQQMAHSPGQTLPCEERRYPYLDRDLIEFLMAIPASQLLRPGQRRSLMRRALVGIVPREVLWRRSKGATGRSHLLALQSSVNEVVQLMDTSISGKMQFINDVRFREDLSRAAAGNCMNVVTMLKEISLEFWLRDMVRRNLIFYSGTSVTDSIPSTLTFRASTTAQ